MFTSDFRGIMDVLLNSTGCIDVCETWSAAGAADSGGASVGMLMCGIENQLSGSLGSTDSSL